MTAAVEQAVAAIDQLTLEQLREEWRRRYGPPPALRSVVFLRHLLAHRLQVEAFGGLDEETKRLLARSGPVEAEGRHLGLGARLTRNWQGREVTVVVEQQGFRWEDRLFPSLSAAATAIAGSRWNGPRFFGLRDPR
jgi:hypothetical protein